MSKGSIVQYANEDVEGNLDDLVINLGTNSNGFADLFCQNNFEINQYGIDVGWDQSIKLEEQPGLIYEQEGLNLQPYNGNNQLFATENFNGELDFVATIPANHGPKAPWVFSSVLGKIFTLERSRFPVHFKCSQWSSGLFVRATPIFSEAQYAQELVQRCVAHRQPTDVTNQNLPMIEICYHVLRCGDPQAQYEGNVEAGQRLSVLMPLGQPQPGSDDVRYMFEFFCKNSCVSGMNRKPIDVVFTLEDQHGNILGRQTFGARICSCPKRDKEKEERALCKDKSVPRGKVPQGKKRKMNNPPSFTETSASADLREFEVPALKIIGKENAKAVLKYAHDLMAGAFVRSGNNVYRNCLNDINQKNVNPVENTGGNNV